MRALFIEVRTWTIFTALGEYLYMENRAQNRKMTSPVFTAPIDVYETCNTRGRIITNEWFINVSDMHAGAPNDLQRRATSIRFIVIKKQKMWKIRIKTYNIKKKKIYICTFNWIYKLYRSKDGTIFVNYTDYIDFGWSIWTKLLRHFWAMRAELR